MTKYSFRLSSRRFIQELFMDLTYSELYEEPYKILGMIPNAGRSGGAAKEQQDNPGGTLSQLDEITSEENLSKNPPIRGS